LSRRAADRGLGRSHLGRERTRRARRRRLAPSRGCRPGSLRRRRPRGQGRTPRAARAPVIRGPKRLAATGVQGDSRR